VSDASTVPRTAPLDDVMLAMDVVDTLRHRQDLVAQELARPESDEELLERLRSIYASQGIEVPDRILREGVEALREERFTYRPPRDVPLWARLYVRRGMLARGLLVVAVVAAIAVFSYRALVIAPREAITAGLDSSHAAIISIAADDAVRAQADTLYERASTQLASGDTAAAQAGLTQLEELQAQLEREYALVITSGPDVGVWRTPDLNQAVRNYYLIVDAVDDRGELVTLPVRNEETGETDRVSTFGLGVTEEAWERVGADLDDDGIIQDEVVGVKERGEMEPDYLVETRGGMITRW
jgi:hypothetical protein